MAEQGITIEEPNKILEKNPDAVKESSKAVGLLGGQYELINDFGNAIIKSIENSKDINRFIEENVRTSGKENRMSNKEKIIVVNDEVDDLSR